MFRFVEREKAGHPIAIMCRLLGVSTSGCYAWRQRVPSRRHKEDEMLKEHIMRIHRLSRGTYGAPRIHAELRDVHNIRCGKKRVARLMRELGIEGVSRRRSKGITHRDPRRPSAPDLVQRAFRAERPDQLWVADMTQQHTDEGWLYLAVVVDAFSRRVIGWSMGERPVADLPIGAVRMAVWNRRPDPGVIHHSDHGSQYTSLAFGKTLREAGLVGSMGSVGDAYDNAMAESFFATLKTELLDRQRWMTRMQLRAAIFDYIEVFYNRRRRHSALGHLSPIEFERRWLTTGRRSSQPPAA